MATMTRLETWDPRAGGWKVSHAGLPLLHPEKYAERLGKRGIVARAIVVGTGQIFQFCETPAAPSGCEYCGDNHAGPYDGSCLL